MKSILKKIAGITAGTILALGLFSCANDGGDSHEHTFATDYSKDETYHWYAATCNHSEEVKDKEAHTFGEWNNKKRTCVTCNYEQTCEHTFGEYVSNEDASYTADGTKTRVCSKCGYEDTVTDEGTKITEVTYKGTSSSAMEIELDFSTKEFQITMGEFPILKGTIPENVEDLSSDFELEITAVYVLNTEDESGAWISDAESIADYASDGLIHLTINEDGTFNIELMEMIFPSFTETEDNKYSSAPEFYYIFDTEEETITVKMGDTTMEIMTYEGDIFTNGQITIYVNGIDSEGNADIFPQDVFVVGKTISGDLVYCEEITLVEAE